MYLLSQSLWTSAWSLNMLLEQFQRQLYLQALFLNLQQYLRNPADSLTRLSPPRHCGSCSTYHGDASEQAIPKANNRARGCAQEHHELQPPAAGTVNNVEAAHLSTTNQACVRQPFFAEPPDPCPVKQRRRCDHDLLPTVKDVPIPNCQRQHKNTEGDGFTLARRSRHKNSNPPLSKFASANMFSVLTTMRSHCTPTSTKPQRRSFGVGAKKHAHCGRKGTAYCCSAPPHKPRILQTKPKFA